MGAVIKRISMVQLKKAAQTKGCLLVLFVFLLFLFGVPNTGFSCLDINDEPMETLVQAAPPNIMFVLDNSGSMDWEFMTSENSGLFGGDYYLYPDSAYIDGNDRAYGDGYELPESGRKKWKSQWAGYNKIFYNPNVTYSPWPGKTDASITQPWSNPNNTDPNDSKFDMDGTYYSIELAGENEVIVDNNDAGFFLNTPSSWSSTTNSYPHYGTDYYFTSSTNDAVDDWVTWTPALPEAGTYQVHVWWTSNDSRDTSVSYTVSHNDTNDVTCCYNMQQNAGQWNYLGDYAFLANGTEFVRLDPDLAGGSIYSADAVKFSMPSTTITVTNAHYFRIDDSDGDGEHDAGEAIYLINFVDENGDGTLDSRDYYEFTDNDGDNALDSGELHYRFGAEIPDRVKASLYDEDGSFSRFATTGEDLQNFANWFSFYRKRELTSKAAVAGAIYNLEWVYVGFYSINEGLRQPVLGIEVEGDSFIIDNQDSRYSESGSWSESSASNEYAGGSRYTNDSGDYAIWMPDIPSTEAYKVYVWYDYWETRDTNALYTVHHAGGDSSFRKDQQENYSQWVELGEFTFNEGTTGYVKVTRDGSSTENSTSADAVKFEPVSGVVDVDETDTLLSLLYGMNSSGSTPLRVALKNVGHYYMQGDSDTGGLGESPFAADADGGSCQQAFTIVMTDGFWNGNTSPQVGNQDANTESSPYDGDPYADGYSNTLADVAMKFYKTDLCPSLDDNVPTNSCDRANFQHMVTYGVSFGVQGDLDPAGYHACLLEGVTPSWPQPVANTTTTIDDLYHASVNGRGLFFSASDPQELVQSLVDLMTNIDARIASGASVSVNGEELNADTVLYQASYVSDTWVGDVIAYPIDPNTGEILRESDDILWKASDQLQAVESTDRRIITYDPDPDNDPNTVDGAASVFRYASLSSNHQVMLNSDPNIVNFIRGDEVSGFRARNRKLGDMVHSAPMLVGETIFAGGNDGMLHAFDAVSGNERFAYIPNLVMDNFYDDAQPDKSFHLPGYEHVFFVDRPAVARNKVLLDTNNDGIEEFVTLLVGGLGKGGKGYYALDITNADAVESGTTESSITSMVQWEFPHAADDDMGYSYATPVIVKCNSDLDNNTYLDDWIVIFGNGYSSTNGNAVLYILRADGTLLKKINTGQGGCNGLSSTSVIDVNNDFKADYVYAGDLKGNMWKFEIRDPNVDNWDVAYKDPNSVNQPLINIPGQPITSKPDVMRHCEFGSGGEYGGAEGIYCYLYNGEDYEESRAFIGGYIVVFGTGKYLGESDRSNTDTQSIFGIWDFGDDEDDQEYYGTFNKTEWPHFTNMEYTMLLKQELVDTRIINGVSLGTLSDYDVYWGAECDEDPNQDPNPSYYYGGWYFDLPIQGERIIKDLVIRDKNVIYLTFTPNTSPCSGGGNSIITEADACNGGRLDFAQFDTNNDNEIDDDDLIDIGILDQFGEPKPVPPTRKKQPGLIHFPVIVRMPDDEREMKIFSSSAGTTPTLFEKAEKRGIYYWIER